MLCHMLHIVFMFINMLFTFFVFFCTFEFQKLDSKHFCSRDFSSFKIFFPAYYAFILLGILLVTIIADHVIALIAYFSIVNILDASLTNRALDEFFYFFYFFIISSIHYVVCIYINIDVI